MIERLKERVERLIGSDDSQIEPTADGGVVINLYECSNCGDTYVSKELESCPKCADSVDRVANERDLGMI